MAVKSNSASYTPGFGNTEMLQVADAVAREKGIDRESVLRAMEHSIAIAARKKYGYGRNIVANINRKTGEVSLTRHMDVVEEINDEEQAGMLISLADARLKDPDIEIGGVISEPLPPIDLGRVAAQIAKQVIVQEVRNAEREREFADFKDRVGEISHGVVKRVEFGNVTVDLGRAEGILRRDDLIRGETFRVNDRIRAYIRDVRRETKAPQIILSRTAPEFMAKLFAQEVPEVYDGIIRIKAVSRQPGARAKIAVFSGDSNIDPVGSCVGVRGSRVQAVISELQGEKIDIIEWSADPATFVVSALAPATVSKVVIDEDNHRLSVVVAEDQLSLAIGKRGQNVRLASELTGWNIDVITDEEESKRRVEEFNRLTELFQLALNVEEVIAQLLASEGFASVEEVAFVALDELESVEGFDAAIAGELQARAREYLESRQTELAEKLATLGVDEVTRALPNLSLEILTKLAEKGIKTLDDIADLATDEFRELVPDSGLSRAKIDEAIMAARQHWFDGEAKN
jgi:N utilization substance protein A